MAVGLAHITLLLLILAGLCLALLEMPVPKIPFGIAAGLLLVVQVGAIHEINLTPRFPPPEPGLDGLNGAAWWVGTLVVPALTALFFTLLLLMLLQERRLHLHRTGLRRR